MPRTLRPESGQASIELVALLPLVVVVAALLWQAVVAGQALWLAGTAARAAARATAIGADPEASARAVLPASLARGMRVRGAGASGVSVRIAVPFVLGGGSVGAVSGRSALPRQS